MIVHRTALGVVSLAAFSVLAMAACSSNVLESGPASSSGEVLVGPSAATTTTDRTAPKPKPTPTSTQVVVPAGVVGAGCATYVQDVPTGPGSVLGMARDPVAVALSNSAELTTLAGALSGRLNADVDLTETLNKGQYTVFAPTDAAFGKLPPEMLDKLRNDAGLLASVLKYHVVSGELDPQAVVGEQKTLQGQSVKVTSAGDELRVNDAGVVCGGIKAANATVYLVDTVLMPPPPAPATPTTSTSGEQSSEPASATPTS
jgi:uncharacterized surface protein with fasciclin (FAS1) repeats